MTVLDTPFHAAAQTLGETRKGPVTVARQRRTLVIYLALAALGLSAWLFDASPALKAAALGLWIPGGGFLAVGGWAALLFPLAMALFVGSLIAWFWAGMVVAPVGVWLGSALLAGALAGETAWSGAPYMAAGAVGLVIAGFGRRTANLRKKGWEKAANREAYLPASLAEVGRRTAERPDPETRELSPEDLSAVRYLLDRALQPIDEWGGFDVIEQFQPSALRYQINHMGFALGIAQGAYVPNFTGYMGQAQRNLIEKYLLRKVWGYWIYESCWGHLNFTDWDPAKKDNIMLTGWFGMHVGQYMLASGDRRYLEPGSLTFRQDARTAYRHDFNTLIGSVTSNYDRAEFGLYACEPNWIYPICNHYGMGSLAVQDAVCGTDNVARYLPRWLKELDTEFTDESGSIIGLKSQLTGLPVPFPASEIGYSLFENIFVPDRAKLLWAVARREVGPAVQPGPDGRPRLMLPGAGLDVGNYRSGHAYAYASILAGAKEFGDTELAEAAQAALDADCGRTVEGGVRRYLKGSNGANTYAVMGQIMKTGDFARSFAEGPTEGARRGPVLERCAYPEVLVARAFSHGEDLELTLYPGAGDGAQALGLARLTPGAAYAVTGATPARIVAGADGMADLSVTLSGRTEVRVTPAA
ncbi:linalool dehydratase/isomerase domain-containing protein [Phenylobacterium conjunctum]|uniref:Linalool dehydratase/isomerase domain-containing protein n=1 Tax=Phenylobacterium conjunctum TaxID=1298959 RepID=A0ABW3SZY9_9CAUL